MTPPSRPWRCTYRLQLTPTFGFGAAAGLVPYLSDLGVSHLYLSPSLQARPGSLHGYDCIDPTRVSEDLGGEAALRALASTAQAAGLGLLLDIVPNHLAVDDANPFWADENLRAKVFDLDPLTGRHRRFFDVDDLAGVRQEDPEVFELTHAKVLHLVHDGVVDGLRIDHPDGLTDPAGYLRRLRERGVEHVWVEKILEGDEALRDWPVEGTVGYGFLVDADAVCVDPEAEQPFTDAYARLTGETRSFEDVAHEAERGEAETTFTPEVERLERLVDDVDLDRAELVDALVELPVYRTYVEPDAGEVEPEDVAEVEAASPSPELERILTLRESGHDEFVARFQQTSAPIMAKGIEDTAFYRYDRLLCLNEVGGDPGRFSLPVAELHARCAARGERFPRNLLAGTTHDTKRSADVRARLVALSGRAGEYVERVEEWFALTAELCRPVRGSVAPSANERWLIFQTLLGAWPISVDRLHQYLEKALREAKVTTSWVSPRADWEEAVQSFASGLLRHERFLASFEPFAAGVAADGEQVALAELVLRLTVPGVPDLYQGDELLNLALVDPDNRRPVDFGARRAALEEVVTGSGTARNRKLAVLHRLLAFRAERPDLFAGTYEPADAGPDVCAFVRRPSTGAGGAAGAAVMAVAVSLRPWRQVPSPSPGDLGLDVESRTDLLAGLEPACPAEVWVHG